MKKRVFSLLVALLMALAMMPVLGTQVYADSTAGTIDNIHVTVTPPAAGEKSREVRPQVSVEGEHVSLEATSWMYDLSIYSSDEPDFTFETGSTYYIYALVTCSHHL